MATLPAAESDAVAYSIQSAIRILVDLGTNINFYDLCYHIAQHGIVTKLI